MLCPAVFAQPAGEKRWEYKIIGLFETNQLAPLGLRGWEVVGGTAWGEGNGQIILKRVYDLERTTREAKEDAGKAPNPVKPEFVDLEEVAVSNARQTALDQAKARLENALRGVKGVSLTEISVTAQRAEHGDVDRIEDDGKNDPHEPLVRAEVIIDSSTVLLSEGSKYKGSEARAYLEKVAKEIFAQIGLRPNTPKARFFYSPPPSFSHASKIEIQLWLIVGKAKSTKTVAAGVLRGTWQ